MPQIHPAASFPAISVWLQTLHSAATRSVSEYVLPRHDRCNPADVTDNVSLRLLIL